MILNPKLFNLFTMLLLICAVIIPWIYCIGKQIKIKWTFVAYTVLFSGGLIVVYVCFVTHVVEYTNSGTLLQSTAIGNPVYKADDGRNYRLTGDDMIVNSSDINLVQEPVIYGKYESYMDLEIVLIPAHKMRTVKRLPDYFPFQEPPETQMVKEGSSGMKWWLRNE